MKPLLCACLALVFAFAAQAQTEGIPAAPAELSGTLAKVRASGRIVLGYREASVPFSYLSAPRREPIGYSIELCRALVASIEEAVHRRLEIGWVPVTPATRIEAVASGQVDLECGSTTASAERRQRVGFSPVFFIAGTKLMVKKGSPIRSFRDLAGRTVAVTAATTNEQALRALDARFRLGMKLRVLPDHAESFAQVVRGDADAFATDDVLLHGLIAEHRAQGRFRVLDEFLSYDPYGIMYRKDDAQLAQVIETSFQALAADGEIDRQYKRWFLRRLPSGTSLDLPMSPQLAAIIETLAAAAPAVPRAAPAQE